jgi:hypothetical protein
MNEKLKNYEVWKLEGSKEGKNGEKRVGKFISLLVIFSLLIFLCTSKMISKAWGNVLVTF